MSRQIILQPNGLFAEWSSIVDDFIIFNCTPEKLIEMRVKDAEREIKRSVNEICNELKEGGKPYFQFTQTWKEAKRNIGIRHGMDASTLKYIEKLKLM